MIKKIWMVFVGYQIKSIPHFWCKLNSIFVHVMWKTQHEKDISAKKQQKRTHFCITKPPSIMITFCSPPRFPHFHWFSPSESPIQSTEQSLGFLSFHLSVLPVCDDDNNLVVVAVSFHSSTVINDEKHIMTVRHIPHRTCFHPQWFINKTNT